MTEKDINSLMLSALQISFLIKQHPIYVIVRESLPSFGLSKEEEDILIFACEKWLLERQESFIWSVRGVETNKCLH